MLHRARSAWALLQPREFALTLRRCPFCGPSLFVRLCKDDTGVRCVRCGASVVHMALGWALRDTVGDLRQLAACEFSARGPLVTWLRRTTGSLACSEYFAGVAPGTEHDGVRCEDMQRLSYADASFDLITHTEVLEHVADDARALREMHRVLRPGGWMIFSVPTHEGASTVERAILRDGVIEHLRPPIYHTDPLRGAAGVLAFRDYGLDLLERVRTAGFPRVDWYVSTRVPWTGPRRVVVARKQAMPHGPQQTADWPLL